MPEETEKKCNVDDILCQLQVLSHLKGIQNTLGDEKFKSSYPEFQGLGDKLTDRISSARNTLGKTLESCGLPSLENIEHIEELTINAKEE